MPEPLDRQALLTTLTTEHFTLQGARGSTVAESTARAALYLGSLSASLVSLGFVAQLSAAGQTFRVFAVVVLPTLYVLGLFTFVQLVESSIEDLLYGRAINRIRSYYLQLAGPEARYFMLSAHDDVVGVLGNMGLRPSRWQLYFTAASMVAFVNGVVGGSALAVLVWWSAGSSLGAAAGAGAAGCASLGRCADALVSYAPRRRGRGRRRGALPQSGSDRRVRRRRDPRGSSGILGGPGEVAEWLKAAPC